MGRKSTPAKRILARKHAAAVVAPVIPLLRVHALVMPMQVGLPHKLLGAIRHCARERILPLLVVGFHVRLEIVAPAEELSAPLDFALKVRLLLGGELPLLPLGPLLRLDLLPVKDHPWPETAAAAP